MSGRRRTGALAAGIQTFTGLVANGDEDRREFEQRLAAAGITAGIESGQIAPQFEGGQFRGFGPPATPPLTIQDFMGAQQPGGLSPYQVNPKFNQYGRVAGYDLNPLTPQQQVAQGLLQTSQTPAESFITPQVRQQIESRIPTTPMVPGPGGGFLTSREPLVEGQHYMPGGLIDRNRLVESQLLPAAEQARQQRMAELSGLNQQLAPQVPISLYTGPGQPIQQAGMMPRGGKLLDLTKGISGESAGKLASMQTGMADVDEAIRILFPDGTPQSQRHDILGRLATPFRLGTIGSTEAQNLISRIDNAIATKLRVETGVAARPDEIASIRQRFQPLVRLTPEANFDRMQRLRTFLTSGQGMIDPIGRFGSVPSPGGRGGGQLMEDANGNRAIVYDDGSFEELP